jgi:hypothetical protein
MLSQTPQSATDLAWQAEALLTADCELAEGGDIPDGSLVRKLIKNVFALSGTLPIPGLPAEAPDPIFAAIETHRSAAAAYIDANEAPSNMVGKSHSARVYIGDYADGDAVCSKTDEHGEFTITWVPTGKKSPLYAYDRVSIERNVPDDLQGADRDAWIAQRLAELEKDKRRITKNYARTKLSKLEAIRDKALVRERDQMWNLILTQPTTLTGLSVLLRYCRENDDAFYADEWEQVLEWTIDCAVCTFAGLPAPPMDAAVASLWNEREEDEIADAA